MLTAEEAMRLKALSDEEGEKIAGIQKQIESTEKDVVAMKELIDTIKKEMGNEDLPLLRVKKNKKKKVCYHNVVLCLTSALHDLNQTDFGHFFCFRISRI